MRRLYESHGDKEISTNTPNKMIRIFIPFVRDNIMKFHINVFHKLTNRNSLCKHITLRN